MTIQPREIREWKHLQKALAPTIYNITMSWTYAREKRRKEESDNRRAKEAEKKREESEKEKEKERKQTERKK